MLLLFFNIPCKIKLSILCCEPIRGVFTQCDHKIVSIIIKKKSMIPNVCKLKYMQIISLEFKFKNYLV